MSLPSIYEVKFWLVLLNEIARAGGQASPQSIYPQMHASFPQITDQDLTLTLTLKSGANKWTNRIQWVRQRLIERGFVDSPTHGIWGITDAGQRWLNVHWKGAEFDYSNIEKPPKVERNEVLEPTPVVKQEQIKPPPIIESATPIDSHR